MSSLLVDDVIYLHGLASSPYSRKAQYLRRLLEERGCGFIAPDLNLPAFESLSVAAALGAVAECGAALPGKVAMIGSSFGALLALYALEKYSSLRTRISHVVLLAPALRIFESPQLGEENWRQWRETGSLPMHHSGSGIERRLPFSFYEELSAMSQPCSPPGIPVLLIHGSRDEVIRAEWSREFAASHRGVTLRLIESGHGLEDVLSTIGTEILGFISERARSRSDVGHRNV